jgi:hypothetical protein
MPPRAALEPEGTAVTNTPWSGAGAGAAPTPAASKTGSPTARMPAGRGLGRSRSALSLVSRSQANIVADGA